MIWTPDADRILSEHWRRGDSVAQIIEGLNAAGYHRITVNMVVGRRWRLSKRTGLQREKPVQREKVQRTKRVLAAPVVRRVREFVTHDKGVNYSALTEAGCKALLDKRGSDGLMMCCGKLRCDDADGVLTAYCDDHHKVYNNPSKVAKWLKPLNRMIR